MIYIKKSSVLCLCVVIAMFVAMPAGFANTSEDKTSIDEVRQEAQDLLEKLKDYTADQSDEAIQKTGKALDKLDQRINELETDIADNWDEMNQAAREKTRENLKELRKQRNKVAEWYGSMKTSSADAWKQMKKGFSRAYEDLGDAWTKAVNEFNADK